MDLSEENRQASHYCLLLHFRGHLNYSHRSIKQSHNHFLKLLTSLLLTALCANTKLLLISQFAVYVVQKPFVYA